MRGNQYNKMKTVTHSSVSQTSHYPSCFQYIWLAPKDGYFPVFGEVPTIGGTLS